MRRLTLLLAAALVPAAPAAAQYYAVPPFPPPAICAGNAFADFVGTNGPDVLTAPTRASRVYGLEGADRLTGSPSRAACLFGGPGNDVLNLNSGGGVALGGKGQDTLLGSRYGDIMDGEGRPDTIVSGAGDDKLTVRDGRAELIDCGTGADIVRGDRRDVYVGCESVTVRGRGPRRLRPVPRRTHAAGLVRVNMRVPKAAGEGSYRFLYLTDCGRGGPVEITRFPMPGSSVRRGERIRIGLRRPPLGWCPGSAKLAVVRYRGDALPVIPVARVSFAVR